MMKWFLLLLAAVCQVQCQQDYTLPLLGHGVQDESYNLKVIYQIVDTVGSGGLFSTETISPYAIPAAAAVRVTSNINEMHLPVQSQLKNKTRVLSTDINVSLQVITEINGHSEGYQALPNDKLGKEYYVSTFCALGGYCQVVIGSAVEGTTQVYVKLPAEVDEIGFCIKNGTWYSKSNTTITLNYPEVVQLETTHELTGTRIYSDNNVAVIVGSRPVTGSTPMYHLAEQLTPVSEWGTEFFIRPFGTNTYGNIVHITSHNRKTFVTMDGFRTVELSGFGQTVKRRITLGNAIKIKSSQPVQVMLYTGFTYASNETVTKPGMTLVPAKEHWHGEVRFVCHVNNPNDVIQVIHDFTGSLLYVGTFATSVSFNVGYTHYTFTEYVQNIPNSTLKLSHSSGFAGIMTCDNTAIFPLRSLIQTPIVPAASCTNTISAPNPNDGVDNDCDGSVDEDYCYENRMFASGTYAMVNHTFVGQRSHTEDISGFTLIKFRLRSCGDVKLELMAGPDKLVISIAKAVFIIYTCPSGGSCETKVFQPTSNYTAHADCDTLVPYWIQKTSTQMLCMGVGPFPDRTCALSMTIEVTNYVITNMIMFGQHSNAVFYYDVYRSDCGGLDSDWRCTDMANNCWEYESDLCTADADWAQINCRKFCGFCVPDSVGKMFVVLVPQRPANLVKYNIIGSDMETSSFNSLNSDTHVVKYIPSDVATNDGGNITIMSSESLAIDPVFVVYTSSDSHLTATVSLAGTDVLSTPIFPLDALGTEYMIMAYFSNTRCFIASLEGPTHAWKYTKSMSTSMDIDLYENIGLASFESTVISTDRPVAIFCHYGFGAAADNTWTQILPTSSWGTEYELPALNTSSSSASFNASLVILATSANTKVEIIGDFQSIQLLSDRGDFLNQPIDPAKNCTIHSNFPIGVNALYEEAVTGAKSTIAIPSVDNYMNSAAIFYNSLSKPAYFSVVSMDGNQSAHSTDTAGTYGNTDLFYRTQTANSFVMSIINDASGLPPTSEAYNHPVQMSGHAVKDLKTARICNITKGTPGDGVDNDCDGLVDEEASCSTGYGTYNNDSDLDADFGEDCLSSTDANAVSPPVIHVCFRLILPSISANYCYTPCTCPCEWLDALSEYSNMTEEEKETANLDMIKPYILLLQIDKTILSAKVSEKESAEDTRASSANIGIVGIAMLTLICCLIGFFDFINVVKYFKNLKKPEPNIMQDID